MSVTSNQRKRPAGPEPFRHQSARRTGGNLESARIIAADPERYPGVMQEWAQMVLNPPAERTAPATGRAA